MNELALIESRSIREQYADRTDALDKVKRLRRLPDDLNVTTEMVAEYYEVGVEAIKSVVKDNRAELETHGYNVLKGRERTEYVRSWQDLTLPPARHLALFTIRTVLFVGMALRESEVAKGVRTVLLDAEARDAGRAAPVSGLPDTSTTEGVLAVVDLLREQAMARLVAEDRAGKAEVRAIVAESTVKEIEGGDGLTPTAFHKKYFSDVRERDFFEHLYRKNYLLDQRGKGAWSEKKQRRKDGSEHRHPSFKGKAFFYLHFGGTYGDKRREHTRVRPGTPELALKAALIKDGLPANPHLTGLFALEGGAS